MIPSRAGEEELNPSRVYGPRSNILRSVLFLFHIGDCQGGWEMTPSVQFCVSELTAPWELELIQRRKTSGKLYWMLLMSLRGQGLFLGRKRVFDLSQSCGLHAGGH